MSNPISKQRASILLVLMMHATNLYAAAGGRGQLELTVIDSETHEPVAVRMQLWNSRARSVLPTGMTHLGQFFCFDGTTVLDLPAGTYRFRMERGPEYRIRTGHFEIQRGATDNKQVTMERFVDLASEGWISGDLHVDHADERLKLFMMAEDLHFASVTGWPRSKSPATVGRAVPVGSLRIFERQMAVDRRSIGHILFCRLTNELQIVESQTEFPSAFSYVKPVRNQPLSHIDLTTLTHSDLPVWLASQQIDSVGLLNSNILHHSARSRKTFGRPGPEKTGTVQEPGQWTLATYYEILNCGFRIPPTAASGSGICDNPVGFNRVYAYCGKDFSTANWWNATRQGKSFVTNGPLLRAFVNGQAPGHVFAGDRGDTIRLEPTLQLATREKIAYLRIVKNGATAADIRLDQLKTSAGKLPTIEFESSGWMMIQAICENKEAFHAAFTAPFYVEIDEKPHISRASCDFFQKWLDGRIAEIERSRITKEQKQSLLRYHQAASKFWKKRRAAANEP